MTYLSIDMVTSESVRALLDYDADSGALRWRSSGEMAGCRRHDGYLVVGIDGRLYLGHRLVWLWMTGCWPAGYIDHANRVKGDDRWQNLREATPTQNAANSGARSTSGSGIKGVSWCRATQKWRATINIAGKQRSLGRHDSMADAAKAYSTAARELHGSYAANDLAPRERDQC